MAIDVSTLKKLYGEYKEPILRFGPTIVVQIAWWTWALLDAPTNLGLFAEESAYKGYYYYMSITMVLGSLVAGATSEGGGAVAFPVMTLILGVPPDVARDFSFGIQSFGMTTASITIVGLAVPLDVSAVLWSSVGGAIGLAVGLEAVAPFLPAAYPKMLFVSAWIAFAVALYRLNRADPARKVYSCAQESDEALLKMRLRRGECEDEEQEQKKATYERTAVLLVTGIVGGLCSSIAGSGLDMATFSILTLYYRVNEKVATPTSVILMAGNAVLGIVFRMIGLGGRYPGDEMSYVWKFISVCIPIVVIGAPLGATISAKFLSRKSIANLLYFLDTVQFVVALAVVQPWSPTKWSPPANIWLCVASGLTLLFGSVFFYKIANWGEARDEQVVVMDAKSTASSISSLPNEEGPSSTAQVEEADQAEEFDAV